jgi:hypothetical protein
VTEHDAWFALGSAHFISPYLYFSNAHELPRSRCIHSLT